MTTDADIDSIIKFWFSERVRPLWFHSTEEFDAELRDNFMDIYQKACDGKLRHWRETPRGCLALVIVFDQFPLNMFRGKPESFATETTAVNVARVATQRQFDQNLSDEQKAFLYMPFMHSEVLEDQDYSVQLYEKAGLKDNLPWAKHHRELIRRFGRFPHRNAIIDRESTPEELEYLASPEAFTG